MPSAKTPKLSRRTWITTTSGVIAAGLVKTQADAIQLIAQEAPTDPTKVPGRLVSEVGSRAPSEQPKRLIRAPALSSSSRTPLADLMGTITPADLHFERHHAGIPDIRFEDHELLVHGMVERPMVFRMSELMRYPQVSRIRFLECSGNGGGVYNRERMPTEVTVQALDGLLSTSEWTGVAVSTILREVGVRPGASWVLAEGGDSAVRMGSVSGRNRVTHSASLIQDMRAIHRSNGFAESRSPTSLPTPETRRRSTPTPWEMGKSDSSV